MSVAPVVTGMRCAVCSATVPIGEPLSFMCPSSTAADRRHVLVFESRTEPFRPAAHANPFLAYRRWLAVDAFGAALGLDDETREGVIADLDARIARVAGTGFVRTPMRRADALSTVLGFTADGGVWVKDETHNVAGSHKARHLFTELVHLVMAERAGAVPWRNAASRPALAIASCGNAAIAASTLAAAVDWPIAVHVPVAADEPVLETLAGLRADVRVCERRTADPAGDPCVLRFREAVADGALPFGVQGTENAWCLDGGRTIGWEMTDQAEADGRMIDRVFVQVGGGAFAACVGASFAASGVHPRLHAVQAEGCAPLERAWRRALETGGATNVGSRWRDCMWPWESPYSFADGILDDETYDWIGVVEAMASTGGSPVVARESNIVEALRLAREFTDIDASPTGTAGLAGVLEARESIADDECVAVVFSGVRR
ncbi:MAG: PLP-dependent lyase/thiolase [Ilumatobacteraceae bacterium]